MRRLTAAVAFSVLAWASTAPASDPASAPVPAPVPAPAPAPIPAPAPTGLAVVALPGSTDAAWPLAQLLYATPALRPTGVDEAHARVLCGEAVPAGSSDLRDLAETVAALRGDDAPTRTLLGEIAHRLSVRALVVVRTEDAHPRAHVFLPEQDAFDAATYAPDEPSATPASDASAPRPSWSSAVQSLQRSFGSPAPTVPTTPAPPLATHEGPTIVNSPPAARPFYTSGWFWAALGAAAFSGGAIYFATRDTSPSTIHLEMQVPH